MTSWSDARAADAVEFYDEFSAPDTVRGSGCTYVRQGYSQVLQRQDHMAVERQSAHQFNIRNNKADHIAF